VALTIGTLPNLTNRQSQYWIEYRFPVGFDRRIDRPVSTDEPDFPPEGGLVLREVKFEAETNSLHEYLVTWTAARRSSELYLSSVGYIVRVVDIDTVGRKALLQLEKGSGLYAAIWEQREGPAWQARHGITATQYQQIFNDLGAQGYRLIQISGYTVRGQDRFAAIWEQRGGPAWQARHDLTAAQYQQTFDELGAQGYRLLCVSSYGSGGEDRYAAIWEQQEGPAWQARHGITAAQYQQTFNELGTQGYRLTHIYGHTNGGADRYAAIWEQSDGPSWQARHGLTAEQYQQTLNELGSQGYRLIKVSGYGGDGMDRFAAIWEQRGGPAWQARHGLTASQYQETFDELGTQGYRLLCVSGYESHG
jgi:hypothetical protein